MAITLADLRANEDLAGNFWLLGGGLAVVAVAITILVYGVVGLIVKMDDVGLNLSKRPSSSAQALGRGLVKAMPIVMKALSVIGIVAMTWVGGHIVVAGLNELGLHEPYHSFHVIAEQVGHALPAMEGFATWLATTFLDFLAGLTIGAILVAIHHMFARPKAAH
jgi:predicted DNA repair protein MutK